MNLAKSYYGICHSLLINHRKLLRRIYGESHQKHRGTLLIDSVVCTLLSERKLGPRVHGIFPEGRLEEFVEVIHSSPYPNARIDLFFEGCFITFFRNSRSENLSKNRSITRRYSPTRYAISERTHLVIQHDRTVHNSLSLSLNHRNLLLAILLIFHMIFVNSN